MVLFSEEDSLRIAIIGCGHVGLVTAGCFSAVGHHVACVDLDRE